MAPFIAERESIGRVLADEILTAEHYLVSRERDGRVILEPVAVDDSLEARLLADDEFRARVDAAAKESAELLDLDNL